VREGRTARHRARTRESIGGCVGRIELDGLSLDSGAESFATRGGAVAELLESLRLADDIEKPNPRAPGSSGPPRAAARRRAAARTGLLGIPANPLGDDVRRIIGWTARPRLRRPTHADPHDRPRAQPREASCASAWATPCSTAS
jgi:hypothetical protein